ncbi:uncharacterized protein N7496_012649 [Penicillium cataractarum]|uniref:Uncharacterized protein n=1 Tax=Penicillium cataractarum TaxID=2100454 RepID=A0A9W9US87_9EURO|nr:uncharacterized protein N7496_012649 [Penicillium cataractarum]KAJ5355437.1 hypothetical protein N7496_012649 [Penicillium cataractarum]
MKTTKPLTTRFPSLLRKKPFPIPSQGHPYRLAYSLMKRYRQSTIPSAFIQRDLERYSPIVIKTWSRSVGACLQQYGSRGICIGSHRHVEESESVMALKILNNNSSPAQCEVEEHISTADPSSRSLAYTDIARLFSSRRPRRLSLMLDVSTYEKAVVDVSAALQRQKDATAAY